MRSIIFDRSFVKPGQLLNIRRDQMLASLDDSLLNYELPLNIENSWTCWISIKHARSDFSITLCAL